MGIRKKISLGFVIIGAILFLSSLVAIFEFNRMRHSVSNLMRDNISSINTSRMLLEITDEYNFALLSRVIQDSVSFNATIGHDDRFDKHINKIKKTLSTDMEIRIADSLSITYAEYVHVINQAPYIMKQSQEIRKKWYYEELLPVYKNLRKYKKKLGLLTQAAMAENSKELQEGFYRSIMPGIIAVAAGLVLVLLFNYFINLYFITPVMLISKGIKNYRAHKKTYTVQFDNDDEIQELNSDVKSILDENKRLTQK